jgi:DNA-directed RNA polymerase subunit RPC12/RpoP
MNNRLISDIPRLLAEWDYSRNEISPMVVPSQSCKRYWWICREGHSWQAIAANRFRGSNCPYCSGRYVIRGETDLLTTHPEIAAEWDYSKNLLKPDEVKAGCNKKAWWICPRGHSYDAVINSRRQGAGCPYCSGQRVLSGFNDLASLYPKIAEDWDYSKNGSTTPDSVAAHSGRKIWWKCTAGHSWCVSIANRTLHNTSCPFCGHRRLLKGFNDLGSTNPDIASLWDYKKNAPLTPEDVMPFSPKTVWWLCEKGHSWKSAIYFNTHNKSRCPYCQNKKVWPGFNDLATKYPGLLKEWDHVRNQNLSPYEITPGSEKKVWWICPEGHSYMATPASRTSTNKRGCPYCSHHKVLTGYNDLASQDPELSKEWDYERNGSLKPSDVAKCSLKVVWWVCAEGHHYQASVSNRSSRCARSSGCPYCHHKKPIPGVNDLETLYPDISVQWDYAKNHPFIPGQFLPGSSKNAWWICKNGHSWKARISARISQNEGCPFCTNQKVLTGVNDLASTYPSLAKEWDYEKNGSITPETVGPNSGYVAWWKCHRGHSWSSPVIVRYAGTGCPYCSKKGRYVSRLI